MSCVEDLLTAEQRQKFSPVISMAREFRTRVGLELPDEEAGMAFAENRKFGKISDLLYEFFRLRRDCFPDLPLLAAPAVSPRLPKTVADRKLEGLSKISDHKMSFETESRLWGASSGRLSEISEGKRDLQRLVGKMAEEISDFVEGVTPLTASALLHALGNFKEEFPGLTDRDVLDYVNQDPRENLRKDFRKIFGFATNDPVLLFNFFCQNKQKISMRGFSNDQVLNRLIETEDISELEISDQPLRRSLPNAATLERLARPREKISDQQLNVGNLIRQALRKDKSKAVPQVYTEIFSSLDGRKKKIFANFFAAKDFKSRTVKFPIKKFPCLLRAVEFEVDGPAVGGNVALQMESELLWRSGISCPGLNRVEHLAFVPHGPLRLSGNFVRDIRAELVTSEIFSRNFQVLVDEERRRLTMTVSASVRLSEIPENFRLQSRLTRIRTLVKTGRFAEARTLLDELDERKSSDISDLRLQIDHHIFLTQTKIPRSNFRSTLPPKTPDYLTRVVFGRTMRHEPQKFPIRSRSEEKPRLLSPTETTVQTEVLPREISWQKIPTRQRICLDWLRTGACPAGEACRFSHGSFEHPMNGNLAVAVLDRLYERMYDNSSSSISSVRLSMLFSLALIPAISASALCGAANSMVLTADLHLAAWNRQLEILNPGNCTQVHQFLYASHARVLEGLQTELNAMHELVMSGNFSEAVGVSSVAAASSLLSAQMHGISYMTTNFRSCFEADRDLKLMTLVLLRHAKNLMPTELRAVWLSFQNGATANTEKTQTANFQFLQRAVDIFAADLPMLGTVVKRLIDHSPRTHEKKFPLSRIEIVDAVYQDTFDETPQFGQEIFQTLFKADLLQKNARVADFAASFGNFIAPLRDAGIFERVDAFDAIDEIEVATHGKVVHIAEEDKIGNYDVVFALNVFNQGATDIEKFVLDKIKKHAGRAAVISVSDTAVMQKFAPDFVEDSGASAALKTALGAHQSLSTLIVVLVRTE